MSRSSHRPPRYLGGARGAELRATDLFLHVQSRVLKRYHLHLPREVLLAWEADLHARRGHLVGPAQSGGEVWQCELDGIPVLVVYRDGHIRTALPPDAQERVDALPDLE